MFRHADVLGMCIVCILWQFSTLHMHDFPFVNAGRGDHMEEAYSRASLMTAL